MSPLAMSEPPSTLKLERGKTMDLLLPVIGLAIGLPLLLLGIVLNVVAQPPRIRQEKKDSLNSY